MDSQKDPTEWKSLLTWSRGIRDKHQRQAQQQEQPHREDIEDLQLMASHFRSLNDQLEDFIIHHAAPDDSDETRKQRILRTRGALRYGVSCISFRNDSNRRYIQQQAIAEDRLHLPISQLLCKGGTTDAKCQLMAAKLLCNLVTGNKETARIIANDIPIEPSSDDVKNRMLEQTNLFENATTTSSSPSSSSSQPDAHSRSSNWVDMIITSAHTSNREILGAVVAALHNCVVSLSPNSDGNQDSPSTPIIEEGQDEEDDDNENHATAFITALANSQLLISNLLRYIISTQSIRENLTQDKANTKPPSATTEPSDDPADSATEWIVLLLLQFCRRDMVANIFHAAGRGSSRSTHDDDGTNTIIFPEQLVLLHCLAKETESDSERLVGDVSHDFLVSLYNSLRDQLPHGSAQMEATASSQDDPLGQSAALTVLDILATSLSGDTSDCAILRLRLGTLLLPNLLQDLGAMVDILLKRSFGKKARELVLQPEEQHAMVSLVRCIGNLCYQCCRNQDTMRAVQGTTQRTGLHVLLSSTSFGHACFTLREWALVAIRNALHENAANQAMVAELEAQKPVESKELQTAGVKVEMDALGKVSVVSTGTTKNESVRASAHHSESTSTSTSVRMGQIEEESMEGDGRNGV